MSRDTGSGGLSDSCVSKSFPLGAAENTSTCPEVVRLKKAFMSSASQPLRLSDALPLASSLCPNPILTHCTPEPLRTHLLSPAPSQLLSSSGAQAPNLWLRSSLLSP
mmetsp:Transcript_39272/g.61214  ORF Transcript_39272/g.61214 Transcript_39272/m.61214 type:complete len:107 (-) Transcript_39272:34-354(-)